MKTKAFCDIEAHVPGEALTIDGRGLSYRCKRKNFTLRKTFSTKSVKILSRENYPLYDITSVGIDKLVKLSVKTYIVTSCV